MLVNKFDRFYGCIIGGAIGDCIGGYYENQQSPIIDKEFNHDWQISDDTQLTLATCEAIIEAKGEIKPEIVAKRFVYWFNNRKITGIGASTLKALKELQIGQHWAYAGRQGENAAGNGSAMRIAPLAFFVDFKNDRQIINDIVRITHKNDDAYLGALSVIIAIDYGMKTGSFTGLIPEIIKNIADTKIRDRFIEINECSDKLSIKEIAKRFGSSGYVVESVPLAICAAQKHGSLDLKTIFTELIESGGDTDTNCAITSQIIGSLIGFSKLPKDLIEKLKLIEDYKQIEKLITDCKTII